jgi:hypothetical protein
MKIKFSTFTVYKITCLKMARYTLAKQLILLMRDGKDTLDVFA